MSNQYVQYFQDHYQTPHSLHDDIYHKKMLCMIIDVKRAIYIYQNGINIYFYGRGNKVKHCQIWLLLMNCGG